MLGLVMLVWQAGPWEEGREEGLGDRRDAASSSVERVCCPCQGGMCVASCVVGCGFGRTAVSYSRRLRNVNYCLLLCDVVSESACCDCSLEKGLSLMPLYLIPVGLELLRAHLLM